MKESTSARFVRRPLHAAIVGSIITVGGTSLAVLAPDTRAANPCAGQRPLVLAASSNPCNPCAKKNPCNPCAKKNPCNPCAKKNPCNPCAKKNPCNPCAKSKP